MLSMLDTNYPGRTFAVIPVGGQNDFPGAATPDYQKFDRALKTEDSQFKGPALGYPHKYRAECQIALLRRSISQIPSSHTTNLQPK